MYYEEDLRVGPVVLMNGIDIYDEYNADLIEYTPVAGKIETEYIAAPGKTKFNLLSYDSGQSGMTFSFYVGGDSDSDAARNVSRFTKTAQACVIKIDEDPLEYVALATNINDTKTKVESYHLITITYAVIKRSELRSAYDDDENGSVMPFVIVKGTEQTGCRVTFTTGSTVASTITIHGYAFGIELKITDPQPNATYVIDGIDGKVTENGVNCIAKTDIYEFPKLLPEKSGIFSVASAAGVTSILVEWYDLYT